MSGSSAEYAAGSPFGTLHSGGEHSARLTGDLEVFARLDDERRYSGAIGADIGVGRSVRVPLFVDGDTQVGQSAGGLGPNWRRVLSYATGEDEYVETIEGRRHGANLSHEAVDVDVEGMVCPAGRPVPP